MAMLKINGIPVKDPSSFTWDLYDLSSEESGRTVDGIAHKDVIGQKRTLSCQWDNLTWDEASSLLKVVNTKIFFPVEYPDAMSGVRETRTFYVGDRHAPVYMWTEGKRIFASVSFNFIEK